MSTVQAVFKTCQVCFQELQQKKFKGSIQGRSILANFGSRFVYARLPIDMIQRIACICQLSYYSKLNCVAIEPDSLMMQKTYILRGRNACILVPPFELRPCEGFREQGKLNANPDERFRSAFYCRTCDEFVCNACESRHNRHAIIPLLTDINWYLEHMESAPDQMVNSTTGCLDHRNADELDKKILSMYLSQHEKRYVSERSAIAKPSSCHHTNGFSLIAI